MIFLPFSNAPRAAPVAFVAAFAPLTSLTALLTALLTVFLLTACQPASAPFNGIDITGAQYAQRLNLKDADGQPRTLADFKGRVVMVFFGYAQCPDVCPTTLAELAAAKNLLGPQGAQVQGVFVSVDPERDTPEILKQYVTSFGPDIVALHGTPDEIKAAAREFRIYYAKVDGKTATSYTIDHTAGAYLLDKTGRPRVFSKYKAGPEKLAHDLKLLLDAP